MLGAWLKLTDYVRIETALDVVAETFATKKAALIELNQQALSLGARSVPSTALN